MRFFFLFVALCFLLACKNQARDLENADVPQLQHLANYREKQIFLEAINKRDAAVRSAVSAYDPRLSKNPPEYAALERKLQSTDEENRRLIEDYLSIYSYPDIDSVGVTAALTPWLVLHHYFHVATKLKYVPMMAKAWKDGNISANDYYLFLNGIYKLSSETELSFKPEDRDEDKIRILLDSLGIDIQI